jgi:hypothetical protein
MKKGDTVRMKSIDAYRNTYHVCAIYRNDEIPTDALVAVSFIENMGTPKLAHIPIDALEVVPQKNKEAA